MEVICSLTAMAKLEAQLLDILSNSLILWTTWFSGMDLLHFYHIMKYSAVYCGLYEMQTN